VDRNHNLKTLKHYLKVKCTRAPAYSQPLMVGWMAGLCSASTRAGANMVHFIFISATTPMKNKITYGRTLNLLVHTGKEHKSPFIFMSINSS